ncbi:CaiB/baiF CoA-transferase family protein [Diplodia seriata]|uniref:CaiB/baiF CoA-transferase family protein n=1 Tax=Diplodia seriata TaxID=420778 RepID=A0A1S8BCU0_9PEZI|nr:CaiB/baiF CoA-transferase family protein [Diplodia seriata]
MATTDTPHHHPTDSGALPSNTTTFPIIHEGISTDRSTFTAHDVIADIWTSLDLPASALSAVDLPGSSHAGPVLPSSYRIGCLAQSTIALSALSAALVHSVRRTGSRKDEGEEGEEGEAAAAPPLPLPRITVPLRHATASFRSVELCSIIAPPPTTSSASPPTPQREEEKEEEPSLGGLHPTADGPHGHIRIHTAFPHHRARALRLLGLASSPSPTRAAVDEQTRRWDSRALEAAALAAGAAMYALRTYAEWDELCAGADADCPVNVRRIASPAFAAPAGGRGGRSAGIANRPLSALRVLDVTRVIAGPVAGRALAAHGADVVWVTPPADVLAPLPGVDRDVARGKRAVALDLREAEELERLKGLVASCDVVLQGYRPGSLEARGLGVEELVKINPRIVVADVSAFGGEAGLGEWSGRRGFDSLVQTCSGMNVSEAAHFGKGEEARPMPCQALDHATGYLLAAGVCAAVYKREVEGGGAFCVDVSLAGTARYLRSLGQYEGRSGFECEGFAEGEVEGYLEVRESGLGLLKAVRHAASVEGCETGWDIMPKPLGSDEAEWQS